MTNLQNINALTLAALIFFGTLPGAIFYLAHTYRNNLEELEELQRIASNVILRNIDEYTQMIRRYMRLSCGGRTSGEDLARLREDIENLGLIIRSAIDSYYTVEANLHATGAEVEYLHLQIQEVFRNASTVYEIMISGGSGVIS